MQIIRVSGGRVFKAGEAAPAYMLIQEQAGVFEKEQGSGETGVE